MRELRVWLEHEPVGMLSESDDLWAFDYDREWVVRDDGFDLSPALPRARRHHRDGGTRRSVQWYFDNLLPEEELRRIVARDARIRDHEDAFALLEYLGAESTGALTLLPPDVPIERTAALRPLLPAELSRRIRQLPRVPLVREAPKRMSVAGAQHKLLVVRKGDDLYEPVGATPSTHILKPDHPDRDAYPASTFLESLTMQLAAAAGLQVPTIGLLHLPEPVYLVERFDRIVDPRTLLPETGDTPPAVRRLHVIDGCQLLDRSRLFKHAGASVEALREMIERTGDVLTLPQRLFRWLVFNLLVGNDDCHLKNLSFIVEPHAITLAPHYDLLATGIYRTRALDPDDGNWPKVDLAVRLAEGVRRFDQITPDAVLAAAAVLGVPRQAALRVTRDVVARVLRRLDQLAESHTFASRAQSDAQVRVEGPRLGIQRRMLDALRHIIVPEMQSRLPA